MRHENKFKIGDRVRLIVDSDMTRYGLAPGDTGTVLENSSAPFIRWDKKTEFNWAACDFELELIPSLTIEPGKHYRTRSGKPTGRVTVGDTGFEAVVDGRVRIFDKAGGHVHGDDDIVEAWVPKVGERVVEADGNPHDFVGHWRDYWEDVEGPLVDGVFIVTGVGAEWISYSNREGGRGPNATVKYLQPAPVAPQPALVIQAGKFYRTRDGRKVGPMVEADHSTWDYKVRWSCDGRGWYLAGNYHTDNTHSFDLIAEWQETTNAGAQVDTLAEEYGPAPTGNDTPERKLVRTGQGYGYELARFGDYVWVDTGKTAPITLRADKLAA